jgi:hypothetical protein
LKKKYDPDNTFWCVPCIGSDLLTYDDERICKNKAYPQSGPAPQTYPNFASRTGISGLPGEKGFANPFLPLVETWLVNHTLPESMPRSNFFKIAMGEGGSALGKYANMDPYHPGQLLHDPTFARGEYA